MRRLPFLALLLALFALADSALAATKPTIYVVNDSSVLSDQLVRETLPAFQEAVTEDFAPVWNADATLVFAAENDVPEDAWSIRLLDYSPYLGVLGYHDLVWARGPPIAYAYAGTAIDYGYSWEITFTHELFEMLADPWIDRAMWNGLYRIWLLEVADPVEADRYAYYRHDAVGRPVQISDFVTENWYLPAADPPYDFAGHVRRPQQVLPGGYALYWKNGRWEEISRFGGRPAPPRRFRPSGAAPLLRLVSTARGAPAVTLAVRRPS